MAVNITGTGFVYKKKQLFDISMCNPADDMVKNNYRSAACKTGFNQSRPELVGMDIKMADIDVISVTPMEDERMKASNFKTYRRGRKWKLFDNSVANGYVDDGMAKTFHEKLETFEQNCKKSSTENQLKRMFQKNPASGRQNGSHMTVCKRGNALSKWNSLPSFVEPGSMEVEKPDIETTWCPETRSDFEATGRYTLKKQNWAARFSHRLSLIRHKLESHCSSDKQDAMQRQMRYPFGGSSSVIDLGAEKSGKDQLSSESTDMDGSEDKSFCSIPLWSKWDSNGMEHLHGRSLVGGDYLDDAGEITETKGEHFNYGSKVLT